MGVNFTKSNSSKENNPGLHTIKKNIYKNQHVNLNEKQEFKEAQLTIPVIQSVPFLTLKIATVKYLCNKNSGIIRWVSLNRLALLKSKKNAN